MPFVADEIVTAAKLNLATGLATAEDTGNRTYTNTGLLDLDALTGGTGSVGAVAVTLVTGTSVLILVSAALRNQTAGSTANIAVRVSGATTIAGTGVIRVSSDTDALPTKTGHIVLGGLNAGTNTFELQANCSANIGQIGTPKLTVITIA